MRAKGEGSVFQLKNGKWRAKIVVNGKTYTRSGFTTKTEAKKALDELAAEKGKIKTEGNIGLWKLWTLYEGQRASETWLSPLTIQRQRSTYKTHLRPHFEGLLVNEITPDHITRLLDDKRRAGLSYSTIKKIWDLCRQLFSFAEREGIIGIDASPCRRLTPPQKKEFSQPGKSHEVVYFDDQEKQAIKEGSSSSKYGPLYCLMMQTGIRIGEALALRREDVDIDAGQLHVSRTMILQETSEGWEVRIKDAPKSSTSVRNVPMNQAAREFAARIFENFPDAKIPIKDIHGKLRHERLIVYTSNGLPVSPAKADGDFNKYLRRVGIEGKSGCHVLRHTFAVALINQGIALPVIAALLGHNSITVTERYYAQILEATKTKVLTGISI